MDSKFIAYIEPLKAQLDCLRGMTPITATTLPSRMPSKGVYLFSKGDKDLYVGRSNNIKERIKRHSKHGATHRMAALAFRLARKKTGNLKATYKKGAGSREALMKDKSFVKAFDAAKASIRKMNVRFVEENDPVRQALLEIYVAVVLKTSYNDFDNH